MGDDQAQGPRDRADFDQRLAAARDRAGLDQPEPVNQQRAEGPNPFSLAMRLGAEMVAALVVAVAIGYGLDRLFHTKPWFMIGFVPIGAIAGFRNIVRAMGTTQKD
ncbi:AtpZ/AtpI family protein [Acidiphilium sp. PA]|uniref:AtpZ/AtpI family protein n=1 Tax=Acidiphilium sp. PA TaxID=2871705 RepID=UPI00224363DA|nr:AtpZ/AtpI family protein [Acidiphilium sp. PA]MCW8308315.1 AtpZ/AtpI family protein [Acidiphilium sp. PA]